MAGNSRVGIRDFVTASIIRHTSRSRETGGTGLGLTIARNIAENHNATLTLANHPDGGLLVTLRLPAAPSHSGKMLI
jgi:signal transduction histidine kinase